MSGKQEHPAGWEYLEEYRSFIAQTEANHPGFFTAFQEALQAQREAGEVRKNPRPYRDPLRGGIFGGADDKIRPRPQENLGPPGSNDPLPETTCSSCLSHLPTPILPLSCPSIYPDSGVDPNSPTTPT